MSDNELREAADLLAKRPTKSTAHMERDERADGITQMLRDLAQLSRVDGCIAAAWAIEFVMEHAAELARRDAEAVGVLALQKAIAGLSPDSEPATEVEKFVCSSIKHATECVRECRELEREEAVERAKPIDAEWLDATLEKIDDETWRIGHTLSYQAYEWHVQTSCGKASVWLFRAKLPLIHMIDYETRGQLLDLIAALKGGAK